MKCSTGFYQIGGMCSAGFLLVASRPEGLGCCHFMTHFSVFLGPLGMWSWAGVQELVQIQLSAFFWRNQRVLSPISELQVALKWGLSQSPRSQNTEKQFIATSIAKSWARNSSGRFLSSAASSSPLFPGGCGLAAPWRQGEWGPACVAASSALAEQCRRPRAEGLQQQSADWADLIELTLPSFAALTFAGGCRLLSPVLPLAGRMLQSSRAGALCTGHNLREGEEEVADEIGHEGGQQLVCSKDLVLQVRLEVTWPAIVPQRWLKSSVLLSSCSNQPPVLFFLSALLKTARLFNEIRQAPH